jgi:hypothetical protein
MDCFAWLAMTENAMHRVLALSLTFIVAGCAARTQDVPAPAPPPVVQAPEEQNSLAGLTAQELVGRYGTPALQIREGSGLKLQFRGRRCVMDAYLYPSGSNGTLKVTHVDTRLPSGGDIDQAACIFSLRTPG